MMFVPLPQELESELARGGRILFTGGSDAGKTALAVSAAHAAQMAGTAAMFLDTDVGQSEVGPTGLMDVAEPVPDTPARAWKVRAQWYVGASTPFGTAAEVAVGAGRLAARAADLGSETLIVDTSSFVNTPAGHMLMRCMVDAVRPRIVVALQRGGEMERWLAGIGAPVVRLPVETAVRLKSPELRTARREAGLSAYLGKAKTHTISLLKTPLRGTRLGLGVPMAASEQRVASTLLGCPVVHAERGGASVAFWTLGAASQALDRAAAEFQVRQAVTFDASLWTGRNVGFIGADGFCLAMGVVEGVDWPSLTATVRTPLYSLAEAVVVHAGVIRCRPDGSSLPGVPERDA